MGSEGVWRSGNASCSVRSHLASGHCALQQVSIIINCGPYFVFNVIYNTLRRYAKIVTRPFYYFKERNCIMRASRRKLF